MPPSSTRLLLSINGGMCPCQCYLTSFILFDRDQIALLYAFHFSVGYWGPLPVPPTTHYGALTYLHDCITRFLDSKIVAGVQLIAYDFAKAFDTSPTNVILNRLQSCDIPVPVFHWLESYLSDRRQYVSLGHSTSHLINVRSGVPQGSIIGPYLFSIVMGNLTFDESNCCAVRYADDVTMCLPLFKNSDNLHVKSAHDRLCNWSKENGLSLNLSKCKSILMSRCNDCVPFHLNYMYVSLISNLKIIGVTFNDKCTWSDHFDNVLRASSRRLYPLRVLKNDYEVNDAFLCQVYFSTIRGLLEYCAPLFAGISATDSSRLERLQKRFHKLLCGTLCLKFTIIVFLISRLAENAKLCASLRK